MKIAGIVLIAIGIIDLVGSFVGFDLWGGYLGIDLPSFLWRISSWIELGIGYFLFKSGSGDVVQDAPADS